MSPIGVFDSGFGGLTILKELVKQLPQYDYLYLGDNARSPYGNRSFKSVYQYTLQAVEWLIGQNCPLVILACNTASAKALRSIQQIDLHRISPTARVLGVLRPTTETIGEYSHSKHIGILATNGTVQSGSYVIEIGKFFPGVRVEQEACPMWVPLVENNEYESAGADYFVQQHLENILQRDPQIDTLLLACTHYPLLMEKIKQYLPKNVQVVSQGEIVAKSLAGYLQRHPEIETCISRGGHVNFYTTDDAAEFSEKAAVFYGSGLKAQHVALS